MTSPSRLDGRVRAVEPRSGLERLLSPLAPVPMLERSEPGLELPPAAIICRGGGGPVWLRAGDWRIFARASTDEGGARGDELTTFTLAEGAVVRAWVDEEARTVVLPFGLAEAYDNYVSEAWRASTRTTELGPRLLDVFYRVKPLVPRRLQLAMRRALVRWQRRSEFPSWPWDESVIRLLGLYVRSSSLASGTDGVSFRWFWPHGHGGALALGHDVETREGLRLALELADLEEELGFRSAFNLGGWYEVDEGIVRELTGRGFEIGLHGLRHDRALFGSRAEFDRQRPLLAREAVRLGAEGFRSPATYRTFEWLAELPVSYDSSISHSDPFEAQPGGCCSIWPFFVGSVVELPYTLPQDHTLFTLLQARSVDVWLEQADRIERSHGLVHCVSHPDRGYLGDPEKRALYAEFLQAMSEREGLWRALPRDVARWWRLRDRAPDVEGAIVSGVARHDADSGGVAFEPVPADGPPADLAEDLAARLADVLVAPQDDQSAIVGC